MAGSNSIQCRLAYLATPKLELLKTLSHESDWAREIRRGTAVITPIRDYEEAFEGWKRAWLSKAKYDFVREFIEIWSEDFPQFTARLQDTPFEVSFDKWWDMTELDVVEIDKSWKPS